MGDVAVGRGVRPRPDLGVRPDRRDRRRGPPEARRLPARGVLRRPTSTSTSTSVRGHHRRLPVPLRSRTSIPISPPGCSRSPATSAAACVTWRPVPDPAAHSAASPLRNQVAGSDPVRAAARGCGSTPASSTSSTTADSDDPRLRHRDREAEHPLSHRRRRRTRRSRTSTTSTSRAPATCSSPRTTGAPGPDGRRHHHSREDGLAVPEDDRGRPHDGVGGRRAHVRPLRHALYVGSQRYLGAGSSSRSRVRSVRLPAPHPSYAAIRPRRATAVPTASATPRRRPPTSRRPASRSGSTSRAGSRSRR